MSLGGDLYMRRQSLPKAADVTSTMTTYSLSANKAKDDDDTYDDNNANVMYGTFDEELERELCKQVVQKLRDRLTSSPLNHPTLILQIPIGLLQRIGKEVIRMSQCEPCGLRGCTLFISVQQKHETHALRQVVFDPTIVSTFELTLILTEDRKHWLTPIKDLVRPVIRKCMQSEESYHYRIVISPTFHLSKKKLYRT